MSFERIVSVYVFWRGLVRGWMSCPSPPQVTLPCLHTAPLGWGLILAVTALSEIKMGTLPIAFPPSQEYLCGRVNRSCACTHAGNCKHICINTHNSFLPSTELTSRDIWTRCGRRSCCSKLSYLHVCFYSTNLISRIKLRCCASPVSCLSSLSFCFSIHLFPSHTWESWGSAMPKLTTCLQGQPEYLGESQPAESQCQGRPGFGLTSNETWSVGRLRWRWGRDSSSCILQIRVKHHPYTQDGLFNIPHYPGHDCLN